MNLYDFDEFVNEAELQKNKIFASNGKECKGYIKLADKGDDLSKLILDFCKHNKAVEEIKDLNWKREFFKWQSDIKESDLSNCYAFIYETEKDAENDVENFFKGKVEDLGFSYEAYNSRGVNKGRVFGVQLKDYKKGSSFVTGGDLNAKSYDLK